MNTKCYNPNACPVKKMDGRCPLEHVEEENQGKISACGWHNPESCLHSVEASIEITKAEIDQLKKNLVNPVLKKSYPIMERALAKQEEVLKKLEAQR